MTRLEKLYPALETFKKEGLEFNAEQEAQLRDIPKITLHITMPVGKVILYNKAKDTLLM